jgi:hypothetical protein
MYPRALILLAAAASFSGAAAAQTGEPPSVPLRLTLDADAGCPDRASFVAELRKHAPRIREASAEERAPTLRVELRASEGTYSARLTIAAPDGALEGSRELHGADCASVAGGLAFAAVLVVDPEAVDAAPPPPQVPPAVLPAPPLASNDAAPVKEPPPVRLSGGAGLEIAAGLGPGAAVVPRLVIDVESTQRPSGLHARLSVGRAFARDVATPLGTATLTLTDVRLEPCLDVASGGALRLGACALLDGVILSGRGSVTRDPRSADRFSVEAGVGLRPAWVVGDSIALGLLLGATATLTRYRFYFAPDATAYALPPLAALAEMDVQFYFW